jgi:hypothetical protein
MKWGDAARNLNTAQRIVLWLGCTLLLLAVLYPEFDTVYARMSEDGSHVVGFLYPQIKREFILNGLIRKTNLMDMLPALNPELRRLIMDESGFRESVYEKSEKIKFWNILVQALAVVAITAMGVWALKDYRKLQSTQH